MKFLFIYLLLDISLLKGQQRIEELQRILLRFSFPSFYNNYDKFCCKLYPGGCYKLLDSAGYTCDQLRGRVTKTEEDGWIEFQISNVRMADAGYYRCGILGAQNQIYSDYYVEVFDHSWSQPAPTATIKAPNSSATIPDSSAGVLSQDRSDNIRAPWSFGLPLAIIVSITVMVFVSAVIAAVCYKAKVRCKKSDKTGETLCESLKREALETSGIVYTTVDFRPHQEPEGVYANLRMQKGPDPDVDHAGMVEYSTLAVQV
ncbi:uncharacterized protein LOC108236753 isoform X2 [Kryptolebias marmoratus]|uniref:uncharacterized protein LOC108236753 isoform X2 n=1 Tax=Kryptolebias marmoratus TaxID=37003 RepID=UPI000D53029B|nr:uncharacterized protein LOC108236753 isoform X2 [Kryptolebias marmoratus]